MIEMMTDCTWTDPEGQKPKKDIYEEKRRFVRLLAAALRMMPEIEDVEYFRFETHEEYVRITQKKGRDYVCVSADSLEAIMKDITKALERRPDSALIRSEHHANLIDRWIEEGRHIPR